MKLFIGCSEANKIDEEYIRETRSIMSQLSSRDIEFILSGVWASMNGACYEELVEQHKKVTVVADKQHRKIVEEMDNANSAILQNTFRCSESIYNKADILLFLPGGIDAFTILWAALKENMAKKEPKPIIIYNMNGYYNFFLATIEQMLEAQFEGSTIHRYYTVFDESEEVIHYINTVQTEKVLKIK